MNDFYFKFFAREFLTDGEIRLLPLEAQAILVRLWCICCLDGFVPVDLEEMSIAIGVRISRLEVHLPALMQFFELQGNSRLVSLRMERERAARLRTSAGASKAAKAKRDLYAHRDGSKASLTPEGGASANAPTFESANVDAVHSSEYIAQSRESSVQNLEFKDQSKNKDSTGNMGACPSGGKPNFDQTIIMVLPCNGDGTSEWPVTSSDMTEWQAGFPGIDPAYELKKICLWLEDHPDRAGKISDMGRFVRRWLERAQTSPPAPAREVSNGTSQSGPRTKEDLDHAHQVAGRMLKRQAEMTAMAESASDEDIHNLWEGHDT